MAKAAFKELTPAGEKFTRAQEGDVGYVYDDGYFPTRKYKAGDKIKGNLTAGTGHLLSKGNELFPEATQWIGKDIPQAQRNRWFDADTDVAERAVDTLVKVPLKDNQRDVLIDFTFNVGVSAFAGSTLLAKVNARQLDQVPGELRKWNKTTIDGKKVTSNGLVKRRNDAINMWNLGAVAVADLTANDNVPNGTAIAEREAQKITPMEVVGGVGTIIGAGSGFATATGPVGYAFAAVLIVVVLVVGAIVVKRYVFNK